MQVPRRGCRCLDGVVLVADRKVTYEGGFDEFDRDGKLIGDLEGMIVGYAGSIGMFDLFRTHIRDHVMSEKGVTLDKLTLKLSDIIYELGKKYHGYEIEVLIGIKREKATSILRRMSSDGIPEPVLSYKVIGSGSPFGLIFFKKLWEQDITIEKNTMEKAGELGYFIIKYIEKFDLDPRVGVGKEKPQIWFIPDADEDNDHPADESLLEKFENNTQKRLDRLEQSIVNDYSLTPS